jgi:hypothetical protein
MKNFWLTLLVILAVGAVSFGAFYVMNDAPGVRRAAREHDAMAWLRAEFHLNDAQFAAIKRLHDDYGVQCAQHCSAIMAARRRSASPAEIAALEKACVDSMTEHFNRVAALMPAGEGARYLSIVLPRISGYAHEGAPTVQVRP